MSQISTPMECRLLQASILCYAIANGQIAPSAPAYAQVGLRDTPVAFMDGPQGINAGFVGETVDGWVVVAFRGTLPPFQGDLWAWLEDWRNDFRGGPMDWVVGEEVVGQVETGFGQAMLSTWGMVQAALGEIDMARHKGIWVTGHSKGGAMSVLASALIQNAYPDVLVQNCNFATPLTSDARFAAYYRSSGLDALTLRYQNQYDIAPFLPCKLQFGVLGRFLSWERAGSPWTAMQARWSAIRSDYVPVGALRYLGDHCVVESGAQGELDATRALVHALEHLELGVIVEAHSAVGRYQTCVCGSAAQASSSYSLA